MTKLIIDNNEADQHKMRKYLNTILKDSAMKVKTKHIDQKDRHIRINNDENNHQREESATGQILLLLRMQLVMIK